MSKETEPIKIGRIARSIERALDLSLPSDVAIYIEEEDINRMSQASPERYLSTLAEIGSIFKTPDFVSFDGKKEEFIFQRQYFKGDHFQSLYIYVGHGALPGKWYFKGLKKGVKEELPPFLKDRHFVRPRYKKPDDKD